MKTIRRVIPILTLIVISSSGLSLKAAAQNQGSQFESFYQFSPAPNRINGVRYPRNGMILYRGTDDRQMDLVKALRALSGDSSAPVESRYFSTIKNQLMKRSFAAAVPLPRPVQAQISSALKNNQDQAYSEKKATDFAIEIVNGSFEFYASQGTLVPRYIDYKSGQWVDWPIDVIFTTTNSPVAATYGDRLLVIDEKKPRSIDLNYYNKVHNNTWYDHSRDAGEFSTHGYIPAQDVVGYQIRSGSSKSWHRIEIALYRSGSQILVFDGKRESGSDSSCLVEKKSTSLIHHCDYRPGAIVTAPPSALDEKARLAGVLVVCSNGDCPEAEGGDLHRYSSADSGRAQSILRKALDETKKHGIEFKFIEAASIPGMR